ncbi:uncharacterized protein ALTATR162_LOCUS1710 [Alternaria atra]|uniref:Uncharacterized protein n=1 Tax=Alternaria atra TaxID=119953 RepID=A0A8J2HTS3_9PLEO|nr:uncharacterized protein ALTATR162_LOCUS1710 [Alternaria atra]CAG5145434.1 unnamed protein product [Alternaria atra]
MLVDKPYSSVRSAHQFQPRSATPSFLEETITALSTSPLESGVSIFELARHPIRIILAEWALYSLLMGQYVKHYEFSFETVKGLSSTEISSIMLDLHRWRRRGQRSVEKLMAMRSFVDEDGGPSKVLSRDIDFISQQIVQYRQSLESMVPMLMSMVQLMDSRRGMEETVYVKQLTHIALFFLPLSFVASLFSMNEGFAINSSGFKIYLAAALPLLALVLLASYLPKWVSSHSISMRSQGVESRHS